MDATSLSQIGLTEMKDILKSRFSAALQAFRLRGSFPKTALIILGHEVRSVVSVGIEKEKWRSILHDVAVNQKADALITITDAWILGEDKKRTGEGLTAGLFLPDGSVAAVLIQRYQRLNGKIVLEGAPESSTGMSLQSFVASW